MTRVLIKPDKLLIFDGEVVEVFAPLNLEGYCIPSIRYHVATVKVILVGPDRKGVREVSFQLPPYIMGFRVRVEEDDLPKVEALVREIEAAAAAWHPQ